jgi:hypothetical protein
MMCYEFIATFKYIWISKTVGLQTQIPFTQLQRVFKRKLNFKASRSFRLGTMSLVARQPPLSSQSVASEPNLPVSQNVSVPNGQSRLSFWVLFLSFCSGYGSEPHTQGGVFSHGLLQRLPSPRKQHGAEQWKVAKCGTLVTHLLAPYDMGSLRR